MSGMGSHQSHAMLKDEWLTPPEITGALGHFDLDPCAPKNPPWEIAPNTYNISSNGLMQPWAGRVWLNPPYGRTTGRWLARLAEHGSGIALIFARTETVMFVSEVWGKATAVMFLYGRLFFHHADGSRAKSNSGAPSVLVAYSEEDAEIMKTSGLSGQFVRLK